MCRCSSTARPIARGAASLGSLRLICTVKLSTAMRSMTRGKTSGSSVTGTPVEDLSKAVNSSCGCRPFVFSRDALLLRVSCFVKVSNVLSRCFALICCPGRPTRRGAVGLCLHRGGKGSASAGCADMGFSNRCPFMFCGTFGLDGLRIPVGASAGVVVRARIGGAGVSLRSGGGALSGACRMRVGTRWWV